MGHGPEAGGVPDHAQVEDELLEREERLRVALEAGRMGTWRYDLATGTQQWSPGQFAIFGLDPSGPPPTRELFLSMVHPEDRHIVAFDAEAVRPEGTHLDSIFRIIRPDGAVRWIAAHALARFDEHGKATQIIGVNQDVTEHKQAEARMQSMISELQHRTRNLLAVVQSIASQTAARSPSLDDFRARFAERLAALSRVEGLLSRAEVQKVTIGALVGMGLETIGTNERVTVDGPEVPLDRSMVQSLAMALHELAADARRSGVLAAANGRISIGWSLREDAGRKWLRLYWNENGPRAGCEAGDGTYGRLLIEHALPYALNARTSYAAGPDRLTCTIELPFVGEQLRPMA